MDELTRLALVAGAGDRHALGAFVRLSQAEVWRLCAHLVDRQAADDLTQETYLRAMASLPRFRADSSARTWLLTIARRTCADAIRSRTRRRALNDRIRNLRQDVAEVLDQSTDLMALVDGLDQDRREAFVLTQLLGLAYAEAAEVCGCPVGTIRSARRPRPQRPARRARARSGRGDRGLGLSRSRDGVPSAPFGSVDEQGEQLVVEVAVRGQPAAAAGIVRPAEVAEPPAGLGAG